MAYKKQDFLKTELIKIINDEGLITDSLIDWKSVGVGKFVVFCRKICGDPNAMQVSVAFSEKTLKKEKAEVAEKIFIIKSKSCLVRSLAIVNEKHAKSPSRSILLAHIFA